MISLLQNKLRPESVLHFFDVSIVLPFYKKLEAFRRVLPLNAPYFQRNGIELILALDEPDEEAALMELVKEYYFTSWKVVVNRQKHEWRNPSKAINVGIRHASMRYVMIMSPESEFHTDAIYQLRETLKYYPRHFAIGQVAFAEFNEEPDFSERFIRPFGSIMVEKYWLEKVGGYDERLNLWGGDDDNIRARLELEGVRKRLVSEALLVHREKESEKKSRNSKSISDVREKFRLLHPPTPNPNNGGVILMKFPRNTL